MTAQQFNPYTMQQAEWRVYYGVENGGDSRQ